MIATIVAGILAAGRGDVSASLGSALLGFLAALFLFPPGRFRHARRYPGTPWRVPGAIGLVLLLLILQVLMGGLHGFLTGFASLEEGFWIIYVAGLSTAATAAIAWFRARRRGHTPWALGLAACDRSAGVIRGAQIGLVTCCSGIMMLKFLRAIGVWEIRVGDAVGLFFREDWPLHGLAGGLIGCTLIPLAEEILFRGILFSALRRARGPVFAALVSSIVFGLVHGLQGWVLPGMLGLVYAILYHVTGSLWAPVMAHAVHNGLTLAVAFDHAHLSDLTSWGQLAGILALGAVFIAVLGTQVRWLKVKEGDACPACGGAVPAGGRCWRCARPSGPGTPELRWLFTGAGMFALLAGALASAGGHAFLGAGYQTAFPEALTMMQAHLLSEGSDPSRVTALMRDWEAHRPESVPRNLVAALHRYYDGSFDQARDLLEPVLPGAGSDLFGTVANCLALVQAERGRLGVARELGVLAVRTSPPEAVASAHETLAWILTLCGELPAASNLMGLSIQDNLVLIRSQVAEEAYHRGVLLLSEGKRDQARLQLERARRMGASGYWFSRRATGIIEAGGLPPGIRRRQESRAPAGPGGKGREGSTEEGEEPERDRYLEGTDQEGADPAVSAGSGTDLPERRRSLLDAWARHPTRRTLLRILELEVSPRILDDRAEPAARTLERVEGLVREDHGTPPTTDPPSPGDLEAVVLASLGLLALEAGDPSRCRRYAQALIERGKLAGRADADDGNNHEHLGKIMLDGLADPAGGPAATRPRLLAAATLVRGWHARVRRDRDLRAAGILPQNR